VKLSYLMYNPIFLFMMPIFLYHKFIIFNLIDSISVTFVCNYKLRISNLYLIIFNIFIIKQQVNILLYNKIYLEN